MNYTGEFKEAGALDNLVLSRDENLLDGIESWLALEVLIIWKRSTLTGEDSGNPGVLVGPLPESDTNASLDGKAVLSDGLVIGSLLGELFGSDGQWHTDIELSNSDINLEVIGPGLPGLAHAGTIELAEDEVTLGTDAVDWDTLLLELADEGSDSLGLWSITLKVVVGDVELGLWISLVSPSESPLNEVFSESTGENGIPESTILIEYLIDDIPVEDLSLEVPSDCLNMFLGDSLELSCREVASRNPWSQLRVPDESVSSNFLSSFLGKLDEIVGRGEVEYALLGLDGLPLHGVLWGPDGVLVGGSDLLVRGILIHDPDISSSTDVTSTDLSNLIERELVEDLVENNTDGWCGSGRGHKTGGDSNGKLHDGVTVKIEGYLGN